MEGDGVAESDGSGRDGDARVAVEGERDGAVGLDGAGGIGVGCGGERYGGLGDGEGAYA